MMRAEGSGTGAGTVVVTVALSLRPSALAVIVTLDPPVPTGLVEIERWIGSGDPPGSGAHVAIVTGAIELP